MIYRFACDFLKPAIQSGLFATVILPFLVATPWAPRPVLAADTEIPPGLVEYKGRAIAPYMTFHGADWLTRDSREKEEHCKTLIKALHIQSGATVCDMGCGNGYYTLRIARLVGKKGRVLAVDIQPEMLHLLELRTKEAGLPNVEPIEGTVIDPKLPEGQVDLILLVDVYHEFSHPEQMLAAMRKSLKPHGRLALVEFRLEDPSVPIKLEHKMSKEQIMKEFLPNGFKLVDEFEKLPWQHVMFFEPTESPQDKLQEAGQYHPFASWRLCVRHSGKGEESLTQRRKGTKD